MKVINEQEFAKATRIDKLGIPGLASFLMEIIKINEVNSILSNTRDLDGLGFIDKILEILKIRIDFKELEIKNFPSSGAFIAIANHPYGGIEGLVLLKLLCTIRPEAKLMANFLLKKIPNISQYLVAVNPFETIQHPSSVQGIKTTWKLLDEGVPIAIFPAGEVSAYQMEVQRVTDKQWHPVVGKLIAKANVPVVPVYFHGHNGLLFNLLGMIHPMLRTAKLPSELFNKQGYTIRLRIGKPVQKEKLAQYSNPTRLLGYLRARTYMLGAGLENEQKLLRTKSLFKVKKKPGVVIEEQDAKILSQEIDALRIAGKICQERNYEVFISEASNIPYILKEIGRLREITFRSVGEGTNKAVDLDRYDVYYHHLFIWDKENHLLVGAYRVGKGDEIFYSYGKKGFYLAELFKVKKELFPLLEQSLELGRSWVRKEYQQKPLPLFLLWKGIMKFLQKNAQYKYLAGPVSISNQFSSLSKSLMVNYILMHHFDAELARYVKPRKAFRTDFSDISVDLLLEAKTSLKDVDSLISELEQTNMKIPVLLRQYISLNAKIICFNIDPKFSDSLDGFLILNVESVPKELQEKLQGVAE